MHSAAIPIRVGAGRRGMALGKTNGLTPRRLALVGRRGMSLGKTNGLTPRRLALVGRPKTRRVSENPSGLR